MSGPSINSSTWLPAELASNPLLRRSNSHAPHLSTPICQDSTPPTRWKKFTQQRPHYHRRPIPIYTQDIRLHPRRLLFHLLPALKISGRPAPCPQIPESQYPARGALATSAPTAPNLTPRTPASRNTNNTTAQRPRVVLHASPSAANTALKFTRRWEPSRCISARTRCLASVTCAERLFRGLGCSRVTFAPTQEKNRFLATTAAGHSPTDRTCELTCRRIPTLRSIHAPDAARPFPACRC